MTPYLISHWGDPAAVGRKCAQCGFAATHCAHVPLARGEAITWLCTSHAAAFAAEHGIPFPCIAGRSAAPTVTARTP